MKIILATAIALSTAGCANFVQEVQQAETARLEAARKAVAAQCSGYGFQLGTDAFAQCQMQVDQANMAAQNTRAVAASAALAATQAANQAALNKVIQPLPPAPVTCTSNTIGQQTTTNCR